MFGIWFGLILVPVSILLLAFGLYWHLEAKEKISGKAKKKGGISK